MLWPDGRMPGSQVRIPGGRLSRVHVLAGLSWPRFMFAANAPRVSSTHGRALAASQRVLVAGSALVCPASVLCCLPGAGLLGYLEPDKTMFTDHGVSFHIITFFAIVEGETSFYNRDLGYTFIQAIFWNGTASVWGCWHFPGSGLNHQE